MTGVQEWVRKYPWFADAVVRYHGKEKLAAALDGAVAVAHAPPRTYRRKWAYARPKLTVMRVSHFSVHRVPHSAASDYEPGHLRELAVGRNAYDDRRSDDEVSAVEARWDNESGRAVLGNPDCPGVQKVLGHDFQFHACAVLFPLAAWDPVPGDCLVVRVSDGASARVDRNALWVLHDTGVDLDAGVKWHGTLSEHLPVGEPCAAVYLSAGKHLHGSVPFCAEADGSVYESGGAPFRKAYWAGTGNVREIDRGRTDQPCGKRVRVTQSGARLVVASNCLYVPERGGRFVPLPYGKNRFRPAAGDDPDVLLFPAVKASADRSGAHLLEVACAKSGAATVTGRDGASAFDRPADAEAFLVERHHLRPAAARELVGAAVRHKRAAAAVRYPDRTTVKAADRNRIETDWPNAPVVDDPSFVAPASFADDILPTETAATVRSTVWDMSEQPGSIERYRPYPFDYGVNVPVPGIGNSGARAEEGGRGSDSDGPSARDVEAVAAAAKSGVKELFDTAALAALVKRTRLDAIVTKIVKSGTRFMSDAADALGHMYWNTDEWSDRFGQGELGPLEDQLRDHFEGVGDLILNMQEKAVDSGRDFGLLPAIDNVDAATSGGA
jgi:hypothetical protein